MEVFGSICVPFPHLSQPSAFDTKRVRAEAVRIRHVDSTVERTSDYVGHRSKSQTIVSGAENRDVGRTDRFKDRAKGG